VCVAANDTLAPKKQKVSLGRLFALVCFYGVACSGHWHAINPMMRAHTQALCPTILCAIVIKAKPEKWLLITGTVALFLSSAATMVETLTE